MPENVNKGAPLARYSWDAEEIAGARVCVIYDNRPRVRLAVTPDNCHADLIVETLNRLDVQDDVLLLWLKGRS